MRMHGRRAMMTASSLLSRHSVSRRSNSSEPCRGSITMHPADAERAGEVFEDELAGRLVVEFAARARVLLVPGHGGGGIVEDELARGHSGAGYKPSPPTR